MVKRENTYGFWARFLITLYIIVVLVAFIYMRFPYQSLKSGVEQRLSVLTGQNVYITSISAALPWGMRAEGIRMGTRPILNNLVLSFRPQAILWGKTGLGFKTLTGAGSLKGSVDTPVGRFGKVLEVSVKADGFDMAALAGLVSDGELLNGLVTGTADLSMNPGDFYKASGVVTLNWEKGQFPLAVDQFPLASVPFENLKLDIKMDDGDLVIENADMSGSITGNAKGRIKLSRRMQNSRISLSGELKMSPAMMNMLGVRNAGDAVKFNVSGNVGNPAVRFK